MEIQNYNQQKLEQEIEQLKKIVAEKNAYIYSMEEQFRLEKRNQEEYRAEILTQNEELQQTQKELTAQREFIEQQKIALEKANKKMHANEQILAKAYEKVKQKEGELKQKQGELEAYNAEVLTQNEELQQTQEELIAQREFIEQQKITLEKANKKMHANEQILAKAYEKIKQKEGELKQKQCELEEYNAEVLTQNEELQQTQEELIAQREFTEQQKTALEKANKKMHANEQILAKAYEKIKQKEGELKQKQCELEEYNVEVLTQNEELQQIQEELMAQREFIQAQNSKIKNSIEAALHIQKAVLPHEEYMKTAFNNYFVIYKPKDIVSGDFWWFYETGNKRIIAAVDCTGHGVAGAFVTLIANSLLDKIVKFLGIHQPAQVLKSLHQEIQILLKQKETSNNYGMDMAILSIEKQEGEQDYTCVFAGAKRPVYIIENQQLTEYKGTRRGIGGSSTKEVTFDEHTFIIRKESWVYLGSDGLADQNNFERKRFGESLLKNILLNNYQKSGQEQKEQLVRALQDYRQNEEQRDDIMWIGFQLNS
jgi:serine phosphatase RsbU (regulator of sigma subunit)